MKKFFILLGVATAVPIILITILHNKMMDTANTAPPSKIPYLIVLGAKVNGEEMSLSLLYRARTALEYLKENPETIVIVTGGKGKGENITEAEALKRFFVKEGIINTRILTEQQSTSTYENIRFAKELYDIDEAVIVSNDFHLYRAIKLADKVGIKGFPLAAETPKVVKSTLFVREYAAILKMKIIGS